MNKLRCALLLSLLLPSCVRPQTVETRDHEADDGALSLSLRALVVGQNGDERPVVEGETLHSGDRVFFLVRISQPAYLYMVLFGPDGSANVLFPPPDGADEAVAARCPLRVPAQGTLYLQMPAGLEDVRVVASSEPLSRLDRRLCEELRLPCRKSDAGPALTRPCANAGENKSERTRSIFSSVKVATASERGVASLRMSFKHDP